MGFLWFGKKKQENDEKISVSFKTIKDDMVKISAWIRHLNTKHESSEEKLDEIFDEITRMKEDIDGIKQFISFFDSRQNRGVFKQQSTPFFKQTPVYGVQTPVSTPVETAFLRGLTTNERMILWVLLNSNMRLSCEDIATLLGKNQATIRTQINNMKQKNENVVSEIMEKNGKKRYFVEEKIKNFLIKKMKIKGNKTNIKDIKIEKSEDFE
jgi:predicted transcriptional regulator